MTQIFYNKTTGSAGMFDDDDNLADWPEFQADPVIANAIRSRADRDALLAESDYMALADRITDDWRNYRQALRDLPEQAGFPTSITWPTKPS
tara:strand:+ start:213 stop:488 length:276 start_codon:yes stop_codon:yes gene_type:complete